MNGNVELVALVSSGGIGDCLLGRQCGFYAQWAGDMVNYFYPVRNEIFRVIDYLFPGAYQIDEEYDQGNNYEKYEGFRAKFKQTYSWFDRYYYVVPDLLFMNDHAFDYQKYNVSMATVASTRVLTHFKSKPQNIIYASLLSSTPEYQLKDRIPEILASIAIQNPDYTVFFNNVTKWAGKDIYNGDLSDLPSNVRVENNMDFLECLDILRVSNYVVSVDCGVYHLAKNIGLDVLLLDARLDYHSLPWIPRWRTMGLGDSIHHMTDPAAIGRLVNINLQCSQTTLLPRNIVLNELDTNWGNRLFLKKH